MRAAAASLLLWGATPVLAQAATPAAAEEGASVDPARFAQAERIIDKVLPKGFFSKAMESSMGGLSQKMVSGMLDMQASEFLAMSGKGDPAMAEKLKGKSAREMIALSDPHFEERMQIMMETMQREMMPIMDGIEPDFRVAMARAYARRFSAGELSDLDRFFSTPTGARYAAESLLMMSDPDIVAASQKMAPELMRAMPAILQKVQAATAHLPPPIKTEKKD